MNSFWAYAVNGKGECVLVRCETVQDAIEEKNRMRNSDSRRIGSTGRKVSEVEMRQRMSQEGYKVTVVR